MALTSRQVRPLNVGQPRPSMKNSPSSDDSTAWSSASSEASDMSLAARAPAVEPPVPDALTASVMVANASEAERVAVLSPVEPDTLVSANAARLVRSVDPLLVGLTWASSAISDGADE